MLRSRQQWKVGTLIGAFLSVMVTTIPARGAEIQEIESLDPVVAAFNADSGVPRVVLLLSPT